MAAIPDKLARLLEVFAGIDDRSERIQLLIDIAERFKRVLVPEGLATRPYPKDKLVPGCESQAYVWAEELPDKTLKFYFAVENPQGISAMATSVIFDDTLSGAPPEQILRVPQDAIYTIFGNELSMGKSMGLMGILAMVQNYARQQVARTGDPATGIT
ncbi:MAG: SufE family protein [Acidobacteria bacterium]|nr:SufE family protein [Acidobacteriota bacterium]